MKLAVDPVSGVVTLTLPPRAPLQPALDWASGHREWIAAQRARIEAATVIADGSVLMVEGQAVTVRRDPGARGLPRLDGDVLACPGPPERLGAAVLRWLRATALDRLSADTADYAATAGVRVTGVGIGDPRRRWGSCGASGSIRYSWRLVMAPVEVRRAVAAHEVAHRVHMNHGPAFHALWADLYGADPAPSMAWLKRHGRTLHRVIG
ncbi:M48 family metallopeptidase [Sphingomonas sp. CJ99]